MKISVTADHICHDHRAAGIKHFDYLDFAFSDIAPSFITHRPNGNGRMIIILLHHFYCDLIGSWTGEILLFKIAVTILRPTKYSKLVTKIIFQLCMRV
ncbi:MAG TPA: hypothetical protein VF607_03080, partial [Verrucomicrobiae bacterium]